MSCMCFYCKRNDYRCKADPESLGVCHAFGNDGECDDCPRNFGDSSPVHNTPSCPQFRQKDGLTVDWDEEYMSENEVFDDD